MIEPEVIVDDSELTPKQRYERRRAEREQRRSESERRYGRPHVYDRGQDEILDLLDRFVTAVERIADAVEAASRADAKHQQDKEWA